MGDGGGRTWRTWQLAVTAAIFLTLGIMMGSGTTDDDEKVVTEGQAQTEATQPQTTSAPTPTPAPTAATTTTAPGPKTTFKDGSYRVGVDIAPGTYRSSSSGSDCYWARLSNFTGTDNILANYLSSSPTTVTILPSDVGFESKRCGTWTKV